MSALNSVETQPHPRAAQARSGLEQALSALVRLIEQQRPGMSASVLLMDESTHRLYHGAAPSLPEAYCRAIDGLEPGPTAGSCGTAAYRREPVVVSDIATDPLWADYRDLALSNGLAACWSTPILSAGGRVLGTFAMYYPEPRSPKPADEALIASARTLAAAILERERAERELRTSEARFRAFQETSPDGFMIFRSLRAQDGTILDFECAYANPAAEIITGARGLAGRRLLESWPGALLEGLFDGYVQAAQSGRTMVREMYYPHEGIQRWLRLTAVQTDDGVAVAFADVSRRKEAEAERERLLLALAAERTRLAEVFMQTPAFIATLRGPEHIFELTNPTYQQLIGHRDVIGRPVQEALPEIEGQGFLELLDEVYRTGEPFFGNELPVHVQRTPGAPVEERVLNFVYQPFREIDGSVSAIIALGVDITDQVLARLAVEEANSAKADFLATMSHELRTPLNAMIGYSDLLQQGLPVAIPDAARPSIQRIGLSARHLLELIEEILTFSRLEAGRETIDLEPVPLRQILDETEAIAEPLALRRGLAFRIEAPGALPTLETDPRKLRQILLNLVGNAVKFTEQGEVVVRVATEGEDVRLEVADTGIGIGPGDLERIFEPFWQVETERSRRVSGTGLGLSVSRRLARLMGGDIEVRSTVGRGTTFALRLPRRGRPAQAA